LNYLATQCTKYIDDVLSKHKSDALTVTPSALKNKLMIFAKCLISNPAFDSQGKETLTSKVSEFGSKCVIPITYLKSTISKKDILSDILSSIKDKEREKFMKKANKSIKGTSVDVEKLEDAHGAGTSKALECTLVLTEGDSAKALALAGIEVVGRATYGVLPLQGKILNVVNSKKEGYQNKELTKITEAMGLQYNKKYETIENQGLRYGHILVMTDQDNDGSHIKGLIINFIGHYWPNLLKKEGYIQQFSTPLLKVFNVKHASTGLEDNKNQSYAFMKKSEDYVEFFSKLEYEKWRAKYLNEYGTNSLNNCRTKYYKVLLYVYTLYCSSL
jgi:DNA topoisomerase-2